MITGPATYVVMLLVGLLLVIGVIVLGAGTRRSSRGRRGAFVAASACPGCGHRNASRASYCARCGNKLHGQSH